MTLYRHYKNKQAYRLIDLVRHSETLEELVLYESLYDNPKGRFWVRPKGMFFATIEHEGLVKPRFAEVECRIEVQEAFGPRNREWVRSIAEKSFAAWDQAAFDLRVEKHEGFHISFAVVDGQPVGFKIGYASGAREFYSWLGAVLPEYQRMGIASRLMRAQHECCVGRGFARIRTKCLNFNEAMLMLNLRHGFLVFDTEITEEGLKLVLEKRLVEDCV